MIHPLAPPEIPPILDYVVKRRGWLWTIDIQQGRRSDSTLHRPTGLFFWSKQTAQRTSNALSIAYLAGYNNVARFYDEGVPPNAREARTVDPTAQSRLDTDAVSPPDHRTNTATRDNGGPIPRLRTKRPKNESGGS